MAVYSGVGVYVEYGVGNTKETCNLRTHIYRERLTIQILMYEHRGILEYIYFM